MKELIKFPMKFRNLGVALVAATLIIAFFSFSIFLLVSSIFWVPILLFSSPAIGIAVLICKYTKVSSYDKENDMRNCI